MKRNRMTRIYIAAVICAIAFLGMGCDTPSELLPKALQPVFSPPSSFFHNIYSQVIEISCATPGAEIHYTVDFTIPNRTSPMYTAPVLIENKNFAAIKAIAIKDGMRDSDVAVADYAFRVTISDFNLPFTVLQGYSTDYQGTDLNGISLRMQNYAGEDPVFDLENFYLRMMGDCIGSPGSYGRNNTGYTWLQIEFDAPCEGEIIFNMRQWGYDASDNESLPNCTLEFWLDLDSAEIDSPPLPPSWENPNSGKVHDFTEIRSLHCWPGYESYFFTGVHVPFAGSYRLTWKAAKNYTGINEDIIDIDHVIFNFAN